ncbi:MAG: hypothetical protein EOL97_07105 [Spirochaetia bacterium]|nr:hypothetical protein [Spirochaetia bacterium]
MVQPTFEQSKKYFNSPEKIRNKYQEERKEIYNEYKPSVKTSLILNYLLYFMISISIFVIFDLFALFTSPFALDIYIPVQQGFVLVYALFFPLIIILELVLLILRLKKGSSKIQELRIKYFGK